MTNKAQIMASKMKNRRGAAAREYDRQHRAQPRGHTCQCGQAAVRYRRGAFVCAACDARESAGKTVRRLTAGRRDDTTAHLTERTVPAPFRPTLTETAGALVCQAHGCYILHTH